MMHYQQHWKAGTLPDKVKKIKLPCSVEGCGKPTWSKGLCRRHYENGLRNANPEHTRALARALRAKHPERHRAYDRVHAKKHPEKMRVKSSVRRNRLRQINGSGLEAAYEARIHLLPCARCQSPGPSEVDHIVPLSWVDSMPEVAALLAESWCYQPLCKPCNISKHNKGVWCFVPTGQVGCE